MYTHTGEGTSNEDSTFSAIANVAKKVIDRTAEGEG
jgi:hypothetical protein